jgi:cytochrome P450
MSPPDRCSAEHYPLGARIHPAELNRDPYPVLLRLQRDEPITWIDPLRLWYVTRYSDVQEILLDTDHFLAASPDSPIVRSFGEQMLNSDGEEHRRLRAAFAPAFTVKRIRDRMEMSIRRAAIELIDGFRDRGRVELRGALANRLPILSMLGLFGLPSSHERKLRRWYDVFGESLANFSNDAATCARAQAARAELHGFLDAALDSAAATEGTSLLHELVLVPLEVRLNRAELRQNLAILLFGGISTVEALTLSTLWALLSHPPILTRVREDPGLLVSAIDETIRWHSPVQSATRFVARDLDWHGHHFSAGETVNCMIGAANRDPDVFENPERFDIDRPNIRRHLGFATGPHACLGFLLARTEVRITLLELLERLPGLTLQDRERSTPTGAEFHQPLELTLGWSTSM